MSVGRRQISRLVKLHAQHERPRRKGIYKLRLDVLCDACTTLVCFTLHFRPPHSRCGFRIGIDAHAILIKLFVVNGFTGGSFA